MDVLLISDYEENLNIRFLLWEDKEDKMHIFLDGVFSFMQNHAVVLFTASPALCWSFTLHTGKK